MPSVVMPTMGTVVKSSCVLVSLMFIGLGLLVIGIRQCSRTRSARSDLPCFSSFRIKIKATKSPTAPHGATQSIKIPGKDARLTDDDKPPRNQPGTLSQDLKDVRFVGRALLLGLKEHLPCFSQVAVALSDV